MIFYLCNMEANKLYIDRLIKNNQHEELSDILVKLVVRDFNKEKVLGLGETDIESITISRDHYGKPHFLFNRDGGQDVCHIHYSISHSGRYWACLMALENVGLDIEDLGLWRGNKVGEDSKKKRRKGLPYQAIAKRFFTPEEADYVTNTGIEGFFDIWVRKEAFIKYKGKGLSEGLRSFSVVRKGRLLNHIEACSVEAGITKTEGDLIYMDSLSALDAEKDIKVAYCLKNNKKIHEQRSLPLITEKYMNLKKI